jgi:protoporphyrin/coproporphyrin ferrochelatase
VQEQLGPEVEVRWAMRYGQPSLKETLAGWKTEELTIVPLYPQFAESSTRTAIEAVKDALPIGQDIRVMEDFFNTDEFLNSEVQIINKHIQEFKPDHLLLSFHGLPEHHMRKLHPQHCLKRADCCEVLDKHNRYCYRAQCVFTYRQIAERIEFPAEKVSYSFQSRLGRRPWIKPYTDLVLGDLIRQGVKKLSVACPSFVADNLETLEEVQIRLRQQFIAEGGVELQLIPALNTDENWVSNFCALVKRFHSV